MALHLAAQELTFTVSDDAKEKLVVEGFDKIYGARPLRRVIQRVIEDPLSEELLRLKHGPGDAVIVEVVDDEVKMRLVPKGAPPGEEGEGRGRCRSRGRAAQRTSHRVTCTLQEGEMSPNLGGSRCRKGALVARAGCCIGALVDSFLPWRSASMPWAHVRARPSGECAG